MGLGAGDGNKKRSDRDGEGTRVADNERLWDGVVGTVRVMWLLSVDLNARDRVEPSEGLLTVVEISSEFDGDGFASERHNMRTR